MNAYVYISVSVAIFVILSNYWKSKAIYVFLFLFLGNILSSSISGEVSSKASEFLTNESYPIGGLIRSTLLLLPSILAIILTKGSAKKKHFIINLLLSLSTSVLAYLWFLRTLSYEQFSVIEATLITNKLLVFRNWIIVGGALISLMFLFIDSSKKSSKHGKDKKD